MTTGGAASGRVRPALYALGVASVLAAFFAARARHDLHFPTPWPDEGSFLWQAINLAEHGTLFAPELNPTRHILWMPPGYMVVTGAVFAAFGFSLELARALSGVFIAGTVIAVAAILRHSPHRLGHLAIFLVYLLGPVFQLGANTARMEPLVMLVASLAALCFATGRPLAGVATAVLAPLIHPNGVFPAVAFFVHAALERFVSKRWQSPRRWEWGVGAALAVCYVAYAAYVLGHLDEFLTDMTSQLVWKDAESKMNGGFLERIRRPEVFGATAVWAAVLAAFVWRARRTELPGADSAADRSIRALVALAGAFVLQSLVTVGWLYDLYAAFAYALVTILVAEYTLGLVASRRAALRWGATVACFLSLASFSFWMVHQPFLGRSLQRATVIRADGPRYFEEGDREVIARYLVQATMTKRPLTVQFVPTADSLLYADLRGERIHLLQQTRYEGVADVYVFHDSIWVPPELRGLAALRMAFQQGISTPVDDWAVIYERDGSERWRVFRRH